MHSPLLGDSQPDPVYDSGKADFSRLRGAGRPDASASHGGGHGGLRSPLLGGADAQDYGEPEPPKRKGGLHSPLLGGADDYGGGPSSSQHGGKGGLRSPLLGGGDMDVDDHPSRPSKGGLHSPLLGGGGGGGSTFDYAEPSPRSGKGGLHSPLLGGGGGTFEPDYDAPPRPRGSQGGSGGGRPGHLHSPLLGGADQYGGGYDEYDEPVVEDDPNVLRSPLLAAKVPLSDRPAPPKAPAPRPDNSYTPGVNPSVGQGMMDAFTRGPLPAPGPGPQGQGQPVPNPYTSMAGPHPQAPNPAPAPVAPAPQPAPAPAPAPQAPILGNALAPEPEYRSGPGEPANQQVPLATALGGRVSPTSIPPNQAPEPAAQGIPSVAELNAIGVKPAQDLDNKPKRRTPSKLIGGDEDFEPQASHSDRFSGGAYAPPPAAPNPIVKMLIFPLIAAGGLKVWGLVQFAGAGQLMQPYLFGEIGSLIAIVSMIVLCATSGSRGR